MVNFSVWKYLDGVIIEDEKSEVKASRSPAVWPSEASAVRTDRSLFPIFGACGRKGVYRMIGWPRKEESSAKGPWTWVIGRAIEDQVTHLTKIEMPKHPSLFVANGVKIFVKDIYLSLEMDVIVRDPVTNIAYILECKSYGGSYYAEKGIEKDGEPKVENLMQICLYLNEAQTGAKLKQLIRQSLADREVLDAAGATHRNRCEANVDVIDELSDGPLGAKLVYINRGTGIRTEFDISIMEDYDGFHYPVVNGQPYKIFTIESIYDRYKTQQNYWFRMRQEAFSRLEARGVRKPEFANVIIDRDHEDPTEMVELTPEQKKELTRYMSLLETEVRSLPDSFFPPPDYEWSYSPERIEELFAAEVITKKAYNEYKKGDSTRIGDFHCEWCPYAATGCIQKQKPELAYMLYDFSDLPDDDTVTIS